MQRLTILAIQLCAGIALLAAMLTSLPAFARAGTLVKCDFISTSQGFRYVGTYCIDFECKYVERVVFDHYCPFMRP